MQVKSDSVDQTPIANMLNASINDVCEASLIQATERLGEGPVLHKFRTSEASLKRLREGKLPDYSGLDPVVYAIWYHACHVAMSYKIFRTLIERTCHSNARPGPYKEIQVVDVGCGTHAGLFGLTLALAHSIEQRVDVPDFQFHSIDQRLDMPRFGLRLWDDFRAKTSPTSMSGLVQEAMKRIRRTETKSSIQELTMQSDTPAVLRQNWVLAMHVVYDETINDLRGTFNYLNSRFRPDVGALTSHRVNEGLLKGLLPDLYPFSSKTPYASAGLIGPIEDDSDHLRHRYKERDRPNESLKDLLEQIRKPGYLHKSDSECPSDAVIQILRRVPEPPRRSASSPRRWSLKPVRDPLIAPKRLQITSVVKKLKSRIEPSGCAAGDHRPSMIPSRENSTIGVCRLCGARHRYTRNGSTWIKGPRV